MSIGVYRAYRAYRAILLGSSALLIAIGLGEVAKAQTKLPEIKVVAAKKKPPSTRPKRRIAAPPTTPTPTTPNNALATQTAAFDQSRNNIYAPLGTAPHEMSHEAIEAAPQGSNASVEKVLLQAPGVTQDSAASGNFHVRNEHGNVQYRINGIMLPDGVSGFGPVLETSLIGKMSLVTGALPAQYGLRTSGVLDIETRSDAFNNTGSAGFYAGSRGTFTPSFEYGGRVGQTEYFLTGRYLQNDIGIENPTANWSALHDHTEQERGFGYVSTFIDNSTRFSLLTGASVNKFQIPNNPGQMPNFTAFGTSDFDSAKLNDNQMERNYFGVAALQRSVNGADVQLSYFTRYSSVHFVPDQIGDLVFNGVASDVYRSGFANGVTADGSYRLNDTHTLRGGLILSTEKTQVTNANTLLPLDDSGNPVDAPFTAIDASSKVGYLAGGYIQDEWRLTDTVTLNSGLRFDQYSQYISENQFSPRFSITWKPFDTTTFHAGYARTFTPPQQVLAAPTDLSLVQNTTQQPSVMQNDPVRAERANVFDVGVVQKVLPGLEVGVDAYYKQARNLIDDGQFGAAYVLTAFNYEKGENVGVELSAKYTQGNFQAYANLAWARQIATNPISNQFLFDNATPLDSLGGLTEYQYLQSHYVHTDHAQLWTGSAGASYLFCGRPASPGEISGNTAADAAWWSGSMCGTRLSANMIYGSGLRSGDANIDHVPAYTQFNAGISREFLLPNDPKPVTLRFDVVNVFDSVYLLRDGSGIGVFAPQYGPRRGFFVGLSKKL